MKKLFLTLALSTALTSACASNKDPMGPMERAAAEKASQKDASKKDDNATTPAPIATDGCPDVNGTYEQKQGETTISITIASKVDAGVHSYSFNGGDKPTFTAADGKVQKVSQEGKTGTIQLSCDAKSMTLTAQEDGKDASTIKYTVTDAEHINVDGTGDAVALKGDYVLKK